MFKYRVQLTNRAIKELSNLDSKALALVRALIDEIEASDNPRQMSCAKKLQGHKDGWRWRTGTYRVLGTINDDVVTIELFRIGHRRDVYRRL